MAARWYIHADSPGGQVAKYDLRPHGLPIRGGLWQTKIEIFGSCEIQPVKSGLPVLFFAERVKRKFLTMRLYSEKR